MGQFFIPSSSIRPKTDTPFWKWANFLYSVLGCNKSRTVCLLTHWTVFLKAIFPWIFQMAAYKTELRSFRAFEILYPVLWNGYPVLKNQQLQNHDPVRWAAHTRIGNVWEYPPPGFAFSSRRGILDRGWLRCPRIDTDGFWFSPFRAGFVRRVRSTFAALSRGTCRGCNCCFNELVQLA